MVSILSCSRTGGMGRRIAPRGMACVVEIFRDWREPDIVGWGMSRIDCQRKFGDWCYFGSGISKVKIE